MRIVVLVLIRFVLQCLYHMIRKIQGMYTPLCHHPLPLPCVVLHDNNSRYVRLGECVDFVQNRRFENVDSRMCVCYLRVRPHDSNNRFHTFVSPRFAVVAIVSYRILPRICLRNTGDSENNHESEVVSGISPCRSAWVCNETRFHPIVAMIETFGHSRHLTG